MLSLAALVRLCQENKRDRIRKMFAIMPAGGISAANY
jgi:hypothetical protein